MLKLSEVAERLNCSLTNVYALKDQGQLTVVATGAGGKGFRVAEEDLKKFIDEGRRARRIAPPLPKCVPGKPFKNLDGNRLREAWRRRGAESDRPDEGNSQ